jgi:hypothetical protein
MPQYYVATRSRYIVVEAANESDARRIALPDLQRLQAEVSAPIGRDLPTVIHVVRPATDDEIEMDRWSRDLLNQ